MTESTPDTSSVMVIYGRDEHARIAFFEFIRTLGLQPLEWGNLISRTGRGAPFIGEVIEIGFSIAQAAVVLLTPDDLVRLRTELWSESDVLDKSWQGQARPNVYIEAGMALGMQRDRTIFVRVQPVFRSRYAASGWLKSASLAAYPG